MAGSAIRASHLMGDARVQDPYCLRCQPQVMGACLDLMRQAAATLADEANGVTDNPLIFAEDDTALSGGNFHAEPVAFAADMIALAICEIGSLAERRIAMLVDPALSGLPAFLTPRPGLNSGFMIAAGDGGGARLREQAARLSRQRRLDPDLRQSGGPCVDGRAWRAAAGADGEERGAVIAIEALAAAQGCDFHAPLARAKRSRRRARLHQSARRRHLDEDRYFHPDLARRERAGARGRADRGRRRRRAAGRQRRRAMTRPSG